ncbi:U3 small nucleolar RNA-associated protein 11 [Aphelenchoides bicaudatus]|nr:U3 small nucleolar RNA-associated protein 11 [Aphelenchoides bicaudatus]
MSSLARAQKSMSREHRERVQPAHRKRFGLLEKKKDWLKRSKAFQKKSKELKKLRKNALERNRDEFSFQMINSRVGVGRFDEQEKDESDGEQKKFKFDGVHRKGEELDEEQTEAQRFLDDVRDIKYVRHKLSTERNKIDKLKGTLHFADNDDKQLNKRTAFVDSAEEARTYTLNKPAKQNSKATKANVSREEEMEVEKLRHAQYSELNQRMGREQELSVVLKKLEVKKALASSKRRSNPKLISKGDKQKAAVFKWKYERKK